MSTSRHGAQDTCAANVALSQKSDVSLIVLRYKWTRDLFSIAAQIRNFIEERFTGPLEKLKVPHPRSHTTILPYLYSAPFSARNAMALLPAQILLLMHPPQLSCSGVQGHQDHRRQSGQRKAAFQQLLRYFHQRCGYMVPL